jgi:hypothetical protein
MGSFTPIEGAQVVPGHLWQVLLERFFASVIGLSLLRSGPARRSGDVVEY